MQAHKIVFFLHRGKEPWQVTWSRSKYGGWTVSAKQAGKEWHWGAVSQREPTEAACEKAIEEGVKKRGAWIDENKLSVQSLPAHS